MAEVRSLRLVALGLAILGSCGPIALAPQGHSQPAPSQPPALPPLLQPLLNTLRHKGFVLRLAPPPLQGAYGLYQPKSRTLWVHPLAFELGIGVQTLLHEAVHAAQSCPTGTLSPIGWTLPLATAVRQEIEGITYTRYRHGNKALEREAFAMQGQPDAVQRITAALNQRCRR